MSSQTALPHGPFSYLLLIIDTSVLLQLVATDKLSILREFRRTFGLQVSIVSAVESEALYHLENTPRFRGRQMQLKKALQNGTIQPLTPDLLSRVVGAGAESWMRLIDAEGNRLYQIVDRGEAFSHAASICLNSPIATNDNSAVARLLRAGEKIPRPILRFWDLVVLAHQIGVINCAQCDAVRQTLDKLQERTHAAFTQRAFDIGLQHFYARVVATGFPVVGATDPQDKFDERWTVGEVTLTCAAPLIPHHD